MIYLALILLLASLVILQYVRRSQEERRMTRLERKGEKFEQLMSQLKKKKEASGVENSTVDQVSDASKAEGGEGAGQ